MTWVYRVRPGRRFEQSDAAEDPRTLEPGEVRLRFLAGGICGSDIGVLAGMELTGHDLVGGEVTGAGRQPPVAPLHEIVGEVIESRSSRLVPGQMVVGTGMTGLASTLHESADRLIAVPASLSPTEAVAVQPISTVLRAVGTLPPVAGADVAVLGTGPIGLAFIHILKHFGAHSVTAVDPVAGRSAIARRYGADDFIPTTGQQWAAEASNLRQQPSIIIDAVGKEPELIAAALRAVADGGFVLGFGAARDGDYPIPFGEMYHRCLTLASGRTRDDWIPVLEKGAEYLLAHKDDFANYISHRFPLEAVRQAYDLCSRPDDARVKVVLVSSCG